MVPEGATAAGESTPDRFAEVLLAVIRAGRLRLLRRRRLWRGYPWACRRARRTELAAERERIDGPVLLCEAVTTLRSSGENDADITPLS